MNDKTKYLITVRFPAWGYPDGKRDEYPAFGVRYLIEVPNEIAYKEEEITEDPVLTFFKEQYKQTIGRGEKEFNGEILFVEEFNCTILPTTKQ